MNKKLIAAAVATACVVGAPAAQAEIKTYAQVQFELANIDVDGAADTLTRVTDAQRGRFGFKGGHDLGGGLKSFAIAEFDFVGGAGDAEFGGTGTRVREINAGLKGSFGSIALGTVKSAYKYYGGVKYDPFVTTTLEARGNDGMTGGASGHHAFLNNAFVYTGKFGITSLHITYSPDNTSRDGGTENNDDGELSAGIKFGKKTWEAGLAYYDSGVSNAASTAAITNTKLFGKMSFGNHTILGQYEQNEIGNGANNQTDYLWLGYQLKLGKGMLNAQYAEVDPDGSNNDHTMITVGYIHKFNKQSRIFAGYQTLDYDAGAGTADKDTISVGIRVDI